MADQLFICRMYLEVSKKKVVGSRSMRSFKAGLWFCYSSFHGPVQFPGAPYSSRHHTATLWLKARAPQGQSPSLAIIKEKVHFPEPLSKLLLTYHRSEADHMPIIGLASRYCGLRKEGMASIGQQRTRAINNYKNSQIQPFTSGLATWRQQMATGSVYTLLHSSQSWDAFQQKHCGWSRQGGFRLFPLG